jgi:hypothetical protein
MKELRHFFTYTNERAFSRLDFSEPELGRVRVLIQVEMEILESDFNLINQETRKLMTYQAPNKEILAPKKIFL